MKKLSVVISILFISIIFLNGRSYSQSKNISGQKGIMGSLAIGSEIPVSDFSQTNEPSFDYTFGGKIGYKFNNHFISGMSLDYGSFYPKNQPILIYSGGQSVLLSVKSFVMLGNFSKSNKVNPYALIGAGVFMKKFRGANTEYGYIGETNFDPEFGMEFGAGLSYRVGENTSIFLEPKYSGIFREYSTMTYISVKMGVMFSP